MLSLTGIRFFFLAALRLTCVFCACSIGAARADFLPEFEAWYQLNYSGMSVGEVHWTLTKNADGRFLYQAISTPTGMFALIRNEKIVERSEWVYHQSEFRPLHYRYERSGGRREKLIMVDFDWNQSVATTTAKGKTWKMAVPVGTLDKSIYLLAMMRDLHRGKHNIDYPVADGGRLKHYLLRVAGREKIRTDIGELETVKVRRIRRKKRHRETWIWAAPELQYLPVRVVHVEKDGTRIELNLRSIQGIKPTRDQTASR